MDVDNATAAATDPKSALRSCTTCSKAKAKCVRQAGQEACERCTRLRKECSSREPVMRRRKGVVKTTRAAQLEKLEHKIEHLVNALSQSQAQRGYSVDLGQQSPVSQISEKANKAQHDVLNTLCLDIHEASADPPVSVPTTSPDTSTIYTGTSSQLTSPAATMPSDYHSPAVSVGETEALLDRYRRYQAQSMPFVILSPSTTVKQLQSEKPVLLQAVTTVAHFHDFPKQQLMVKRLIRDISERTMINGEKSLDLLQGILVLISWFHPHIWSIPQVSNLLHIAQALIVDLNLDRAPQPCPEFKQGPQKLGPPPRQNATLEENRAFAGTFFLVSMLFSSFKKLVPMRRSKYLEEVLGVLERAHEYETDLILVQMVRLQFIADDVSIIETPSAPIEMYVKAFRADLEQLRENDPCRPMDNMFLRLQYVAVEILIWELSLNDLQDNSTKPLRSHLDNLCRLVEAIRVFCDVFFAIPSSLYLTLPFQFFGQFAHAFIALVKLASLEVDGWSVKDLAERISFSDIIEETATLYENGSKHGPDGMALNNDSFVKWAQRVRWMKTVYEAKFSQDGSDGAAENRSETTKSTWSRQPASGYDVPTPAQQQPTPPDDVLSGDFFNYLDENFWQSFAGDGLDLGLGEMTMT